MKMDMVMGMEMEMEMDYRLVHILLKVLLNENKNDSLRISHVTFKLFCIVVVKLFMMRWLGIAYKRHTRTW
jgi:hypothetical protein